MKMSQSSVRLSMMTGEGKIVMHATIILWGFAQTLHVALVI